MSSDHQLRYDALRLAVKFWEGVDLNGDDESVGAADVVEVAELFYEFLGNYVDAGEAEDDLIDEDERATRQEALRRRTAMIEDFCFTCGGPCRFPIKDKPLMGVGE